VVKISSPADLVDQPLRHDRGGTSDGGSPLLALALDGPVSVQTLAAVAAATPSRVVIGILRGEPPQDELLSALTLTLTTQTDLPRAVVTVDDVDGALATISRQVEQCPAAARVLADLLRLTEHVSVRDGLFAESLAYSMLLGGSEFARWRAGRRVRPVPVFEGSAVRMTRRGDELDVVLDRPSRHNSFTAEMRDALVEALVVPAVDETVTRVRLMGNGPSFSSGGDLDEFGTAHDLVAAHQIRLERSAGWAVHSIADRVEAHLHGSCVGAGIEVPAFAGRVVAARNARLSLPELSFGLVPGAGGTVSVSRRVGRWRCAWMVLSGQQITAETALGWGLVDELE
jgi:Enoyl-CoA hydratase/isomerase